MMNESINIMTFIICIKHICIFITHLFNSLVSCLLPPINIYKHLMLKFVVYMDHEKFRQNCEVRQKVVGGGSGEGFLKKKIFWIRQW